MVLVILGIPLILVFVCFGGALTVLFHWSWGLLGGIASGAMYVYYIKKFTKFL